ncbi:MAG TPA: hypothetical protein VEX86_26145, partial [Longimicrobium sp.]|nr:hypothetical protein [Longimicrobium sp.]
ARYNVRTLLAPRIVIDSLTMYRPRIWVFKLPGDSLWNYQQIFRDTTVRDTTRPRVERSTALGFVRFVNGTVRIETPFRPDSTLPERERQRIVRGFLSDTGTVIIRQVPRGYVRTVDVSQLHGVLTRVRFGPGSQLGTTAKIDTLRGNVQFFREPIVIRFMRGTFSLPGAEMSSTGYTPYRGLKTGFAEFDIPEARLPASTMAVSGVVRFDNYPRWFNPALGPMYDIALRGDSVSFKDFQWLYPKFPGNLAGKMNLLIENRPEGLMIDARNARLHAPGTRINGNFGFILADTIRFVDVNVDARPIRVSLIEQMLPDGLPVRGLVLGGAEIRGNNAPARTGSNASADDGADDDMDVDVEDEAEAPAPPPAPVRRPAARAPRADTVVRRAPAAPVQSDTATAAAIRRGEAVPPR